MAVQGAWPRSGSTASRLIPSKFFKVMGVADDEQFWFAHHVGQEWLGTQLGGEFLNCEDLRVHFAADRRLREIMDEAAIFADFDHRRWSRAP